MNQPYWHPFELTNKAIAQKAVELLVPQCGQPDIEGAIQCLQLASTKAEPIDVPEMTQEQIDQLHLEEAQFASDHPEDDEPTAQANSHHK